MKSLSPSWPARTIQTTSRRLSDVAGAKIDEVFIGSCMTNIGHFRAASKLLEGKRDIPVKLWVAPPTKMDAQQLTEEGHYGVFGTAGARTEMPGCSFAWVTRHRCVKARP
jgi:aconitate hydratase 2 / 2-methylisocitrate dehydratase